MEDKALILDSYKWPCWPVLPVKMIGKALGTKERTLGVTLGVLLHSAMWDDGKVHVLHVNMYNLPPTLQGVPETTYDSVDDMLQAGWVVD